MEAEELFRDGIPPENERMTGFQFEKSAYHENAESLIPEMMAQLAACGPGISPGQSVPESCRVMVLGGEQTVPLRAVLAAQRSDLVVLSFGSFS